MSFFSLSRSPPVLLPVASSLVSQRHQWIPRGLRGGRAHNRRSRSPEPFGRQTTWIPLVRITFHVDDRKLISFPQAKRPVSLLKKRNDGTQVICAECSSLLREIALASNKYHEAVTRLAAQAGRGNPRLFRELLSHCQTCAQHYRRVTAALSVHHAGQASSHSYLNATNGSTRVARRAGK